MTRTVSGCSIIVITILCSASVHAGEFAQAPQLLGEAQQLLDQASPEPDLAAFLWADIGRAEAVLGHNVDAERSFRKAWKLSAAIKNEFFLLWAPSYIADQQARAGQVRQAVAESLGLNAHVNKPHLILNVAAVQEEARDFAGSRRTLRTSPDQSPEGRAETALAVAVSYAVERNFTDALRTCDLINVDFMKAQRLLDGLKPADPIDKLPSADHAVVFCALRKAMAIGLVVTHLTKAGQFDAAFAATKRIGLRANHDRELAKLAMAAAAAGRLPLAQACFSKITDRYRKDQASVGLAAALVRNGQFKEAHDLVESVDDPVEKVDASFGIAAAHAARGDEASVHNEYHRIISDGIATRGSVSTGQKQIISGFLSGGHLAKAMTFADLVKLPEPSSEAFQGIGMAASSRGEKDEAKSLFAESRTAAEKIDSPSSRVRRLVEIATAQFDAGDHAAAKATLEAASDTSTHKLGVTDSAEVERLIELATAQAAISGPESAGRTISQAWSRYSNHIDDKSDARLLQKNLHARKPGSSTSTRRSPRAKSETARRACLLAARRRPGHSCTSRGTTCP